MIARDTSVYKEAAAAAARIYNEQHNADASPSAILRMAREHRRHKRTAPALRVMRPTHSFPTEQPTDRTSIPRYDGYWRLEREQAIVVGDVHVPTTDWAFAARVAQVARTWGIKTLCIIGDLFNFDALSSYPNLLPGIGLGAEIGAAKDLIAEWLNAFDEIYMTLGNHEHRLMKDTGLAFTYSEILTMITTDARFKLSPYSHMEVTSAGERFRLTHQRNYSKIKLRVARDLAAKHNCHIITHHQHHSATGVSDSGRHLIIDNGGLHDAQSMAYVQLVDSTSPRMTNGFVLINDGTAHLLTPYPWMTDWRLWVGERDEKIIDFREEKAA